MRIKNNSVFTVTGRGGSEEKQAPYHLHAEVVILCSPISDSKGCTRQQPQNRLHKPRITLSTPLRYRQAQHPQVVSPLAQRELPSKNNSIYPLQLMIASLGASDTTLTSLKVIWKGSFAVSTKGDVTVFKSTPMDEKQVKLMPTRDHCPSGTDLKNSFISICPVKASHNPFAASLNLAGTDQHEISSSPRRLVSPMQ